MKALKSKLAKLILADKKASNELRLALLLSTPVMFKDKYYLAKVVPKA